MNKSELRKLYVEIRDNIKNKNMKSNIIFNKLISLDEYKSANVIAIYKSFRSEVDTTKIIEFSLDKKIVCLPKIENNIMRFYKINGLSELKIGTYNIEEPTSNEIITNIDLIIVPGLVFDKHGNRIGYGGGFYDKYLSSNDIYSIGICYREQMVDSIFASPTDVKIKKLVSD